MRKTSLTKTASCFKGLIWANLCRVLRLVLALIVLTCPVRAEGLVPVSISPVLPEGAPAVPISWSAVPLDLPAGADVLESMVMTPGSVLGPWQVDLEPGQYLISGFTEAELYEITATVTAETRTIDVPVLSVEPTVALRCTDAARCDYSHPETGLSLTLPKGWAVDVPYRADLGGGVLADEVSTVLFEDVEGDGAAVWFLNPVDWIEEPTTPCRDVDAGVLCTFDLSPAALAAFDVIAPSIRLAR